ncbi:MAG: hypothetical protein LBO74_03080 [Candidatus Symbiothrix sp.]|jgi:hypothetical protein|nr:hypothetical protein [Candidatus Symbiothrix sp.]
MTTIEVTSRQLKKKKKLFNLVLTPVKKEVEIDSFFTPEMLKRIEKSRQQAKEGKTTLCRTKEESMAFLDSL